MQDILNQLIDLNEDQLIELNSSVIGQLKRMRAAKSRSMKMSLNEGDIVKWNSRKGGAQTGTVVSVKRKYAHVTVNHGARWRVPMNMLTVISKKTA